MENHPLFFLYVSAPAKRGFYFLKKKKIKKRKTASCVALCCCFCLPLIRDTQTKNGRLRLVE
jgi:hypothetical protein